MADQPEYPVFKGGTLQQQHGPTVAKETSILRLLLTSFAVFALVCVGLWYGCGYIANKDDRERAANAEKYYGDPNTPGTKAYGMAHEAEIKAAQKAKDDAADLAAPTMDLAKLSLCDLIGASRATVERVLGKGTRKFGDDVIDKDGTMLTVAYSDGAVNQILIKPKNYIQRRDAARLEHDLEADGEHYRTCWNPKTRKPPIKLMITARADDAIVVDYSRFERDLVAHAKERAGTAREALATGLQRQMRNDGFAVNVSMDGTTLQIEWAGCSSAQLSTFVDGARRQLRDAFVSRVVCDSGLGITWDLAP